MKQNHRFGKGLRTILCECGEEILVIPDIDEMIRCIEAHAIFHEKKETDPKKAQCEHYRIEEQLARKVIIKIADNSNKRAR